MSDNKNEVLSNNMLKLIYSSIQKKIYLLLPIMTDYTYLPMDFTSHYHIHPVYHMVFIFEGQGFLEYTNHSLALKEKDIVLINPMDKHIFTTKDKHLNYFTINFYMFPISTNNDEIDKIIRKYPHNMKDPVLNAETEKLEEIIGIKHKNGLVLYNPAYWEAIKQDIISFRNNIEDYINALRFNMSDEVIHINYINSAFDFFNRITTRYFLNRQLYNNKYNDILINKIINYLESNLDKKLDLKDMAEILEYNPAYLSNYFSTKMNITISEYLNRLRVNKACEYLKYTNSSIVEISNILGYSSSQHFTRTFKNTMNVTPREYRKNTEMY